MFSFNTYERETSSLILTTTLKVQKLGACFFFFLFYRFNFIENDIISYLGKKKGRKRYTLRILPSFLIGRKHFTCPLTG